jgi:uncharacterized membrane protein YdfJ with MMPL/SSD domain
VGDVVEDPAVTNSGLPMPALLRGRQVWSPAMRRYMKRLWPTLAVSAVVLVAAPLIGVAQGLSVPLSAWRYG